MDENRRYAHIMNSSILTIEHPNVITFFVTSDSLEWTQNVGFLFFFNFLLTVLIEPRFSFVFFWVVII